MASANVTNTYVVPGQSKVAPYYDDFDESKNFQRILFRPGYAVQARELTQLQTILQNQIERFGRHIFTNGSPVIGGDIYIPNDSTYTMNLKAEYGSSNTAVTAANFKDKTVVLYKNGVEDRSVVFRVAATVEFANNNPPAICGTFITDRGFGVNDTIKVEGENIFANIAASNAASTSKLAYIRDSIFFYDGYFVKVPKQTIIIGRSDELPSVKVGLELDESIVTEESDTSLLDPAQEASNYQAPGAARYQMYLNLATRSLDSTDDTKFIELARVENGVLTKLVKYPVYSEIEEVFARRTYEESGNYTVRPFTLNLDQDRFDPAGYVQATLGPGKAYIYGYEYETIGQTSVRIPKARTKKFIDDFYLNMNYGNYVIVDGLRGVFDLTKMETVDIHSVPSQFIDYTSNNTYQSTKIGTTRVRDIEFYGGDVDVSARRYEFYLFDTNFRSITSNANTVTSNSIIIFDGSSKLSANDGTYVGGTLKITAGPAAGYAYNISRYDGSSREIWLSQNFLELPTSTSNVSIEFDFADAESFVVSKVYTPGASANANTNINTLNKTDGTVNGSAYISEPSLSSLVFTLPESYISSGIANVSYTYRKQYTGVNFVDGVSDILPSGLTEQFVGASSTSNTSSTVMNNFLVICTDKQTSSRSNGEIIKVTTSVTSGTPEAAQFDSSGGTGDTFYATVYAKMEFKNGVLPKYKTFVQANTTTLSSEAAVQLTGWSTGSTANVYANAAQVLIVSPTKKIGIPETLYVSDVIGIDKIYDLAGAIPNAGDIITGYTDVTERYELDTGQRDTHYDHASIKLRPDWPAPKGPLLVCFYYYKHTSVAGGGGFFTVDSYPSLGTDIINNGKNIGDGYSVIPSYTRSDGTTVELRDSVDFRPNRVNASNAAPNYVLSNIQNPISTTDFRLDYEYYLGRRDLLVLTADRTIERIPGVPAKFPQDPSVPNRVMVLYSLNILPYTENTQSVAVKYIDNRRYTMRDIGRIDKRVENLEYYVSLNALEKKALDMSITDVNGLERTKYGIFADSFTGHSLGNFKLRDYKCAMNFDEGYLQCQANTTGYPLQVNTALSTGVTIHRDKITLNYVEVPFISQSFATKDAPVAEFMYGSFNGNIVTLPEADIWKSTTVEPDIIVTDTNTTEIVDVKVFQSIVDSQSRSA